MNHDTDHDPGPGRDSGDDELRTQLAALDPAASLSPADPSRVARLLEDTMTDTLTDESRADGTHHRSRLTWIVAAAAFVVIGGGVVFAVSQGGDEPAPVASTEPSPAAPTTAETVTELGVEAGAVAAKCMAVVGNPAAVDVLAGQSVAFDGTVTSISGDKVTLEPSTFYAGEETDLVVVDAPGSDMEALLSAVSFEEGARYLVSGDDGRVTVCGFSAAYSDELAAVYAEAFGG